LAEEKGASYWKALGTLFKGSILAMTGEASLSIQLITSGTTSWRSTGASVFMPFWLSLLAIARADVDEFDEALNSINEAVACAATTKETWCEAEVHRVAGEITLKLPGPDVAKAEAYFERALEVACQQQAKSWELRAPMSLARLWRAQGKVQQARELLAPVYGWFTEGFDTRDLKEAKALLEELTA
jgi:predicted ATPase